MAVICKNCGGSHPVWDCPKPPKESTAARNGRAGTEAVDTVRSGKGSLRRKPIGPESLNDGTVSGEATASEYQASPVGTHPKPFDKGEYQRDYMRDSRTIKRLGLNCTVKQYRATKGE